MIRNDFWLNATTIIAILAFLILIPIGLLRDVYGFIPDMLIFIGLTLFYYWTYDTFRMNLPIFTLLIVAHLLHGFGVFGWYHISPLPIQWDHITHFFGALPFALLFFRFFEPMMDTRLTRKTIILLIAVFFAATGVGALVEISEFVGYLVLGFGEGAFMFGPGDGVVGLQGSDLIDSLGGGWINAGWDFIYNTLGILTGMAVMLAARVFKKKEQTPYYLDMPSSYSRKI